MKRTFFNSKSKDKQYLVIGCGRFGSSVAKKMCQLGNEVMVIDKDEDSINNIAELVTHTAIVDVTEERDLKSIGLGNFDVVIVAISSDVRASIMATVMAKEMGVPKVVCKAKDELQAKVLYKIGADKVVFPERDMGIRLAYNLALQNADIEWKNPYANPVISPNLGIKLIDKIIPPIASIANTIKIIFLVKLTIPDKSI